MLRRQLDRLFLAGIFVADLALVAACWFGAYFLRWPAGLIAPVGDTPPINWCVETLPVVLLASIAVYRGVGLYQIGRRLTWGGELALCLKGAAAVAVITLVFIFYSRHRYESRLAILMFLGLNLVALIGLRRLVALALHRRRAIDGPKALIVGSGRLARSTELALKNNAWIGIKPVGLVDDVAERPEKRIAIPSKTVGTIDQLPELIESFKVDYVFVALPLERYLDVRRVFKSMRDSLVETRFVPDVPTGAAVGFDLGYVDELPILSLRPVRHTYVQDMVKRAMDVTFSLVGLVVLSPFLLLIGAIIKWSDGGPIFYFQERMGLDGRSFQMIKFRSMRIDAESTTGPIWASQGDDRRTRLGAFLRKTSIDELPQLVNVLAGEMSLVGPRPERPHFIRQFQRTIPRYMLRHSMKAGITGWAQVNGWRGDTSLKKRIQYDLYYIANWSLWFDLRILALTCLRVLNDRNAY